MKKNVAMFDSEERFIPYEEVLSFEDFIEDAIDSVLIKGVIAKLCGKKYEIIDPELGYREGWYKVILDETTRKKAYIRKDDERLCFVTWEEEFCENRDTVNFHGHKLYDRPKGKLIEMDDDEKSYCCILQTEGDWMQVGKGQRYMQEHLGWLRWRDDNGILPGIYTYSVVY